MPPKKHAAPRSSDEYVPRKGKAKSHARDPTPTANKRKKKSSEKVKPTEHPIRRLLAQRKNAKEEPEYLVDWLPTWEPRDALRDDEGRNVMEEWTGLKDKQEKTFEFNGVQVLKCSNETEDNSPGFVKNMREKVVVEFKKYMAGDPAARARDLFEDDDWIWGSSKHERNAGELSSTRSAPSAAEVLRLTYIAMRDMWSAGNREFEQSDLKYGSIKLKYIGQVDTTVEQSLDWLKKTRPAATVLSFLDPLFDKDLCTMDFKTWKTENMHGIAVLLSKAVKKFATHTPYLLKQPWPLMFTRLFWFSDELSKEFKPVKIKVEHDWCDRTRDYFLYTYLSDTKDWDTRPIDCVERTYLATRDEMRTFVKKKYDRDGRPIAVGEGPQDGDQGELGDDEDEDVDMGDFDE